MAKEYIERNELLKWAREFYPEEKVFASKVFASAVINAPTADVQEVVRCKDCRWRGTEECSMYYRCNCGEQHTWETDNDFCSCGEKMDKE